MNHITLIPKKGDEPPKVCEYPIEKLRFDHIVKGLDEATCLSCLAIRRVFQAL